MNYLDEFGLSEDDIKAIDEGIEEANKFFDKVSIKDFFIGESTESPIRALVSTHNNLFLKCGIRTHDSANRCAHQVFYECS
jgi:hypothetical protein